MSLKLTIRRSVRVFPDVRLNFSSRGVSTTIGGPGATMTVGPRGTSVHLVGLPGAGISWQERWAAGAQGSGLPSRRELASQPPLPLPEVVGVSTAGEIRSAGNDAITSDGLRGLRELLSEAHHEVRRLKSELSGLTEQMVEAQGKAVQWENGWFLRRIRPKKYAVILADREEACRHVRETERAIEQCHIAVEIEMTPAMERTYEALVGVFRELAACRKCWDTTAFYAINQVRERSSAAHSVTRVPVVLDVRSAEIVALSRAALRFPNANGGDLFIFPGFLLLLSTADDFALVALEDVQLDFRVTKFIEEGGVPSDSRILGETWHKVNKDGSPDRRFTSNYRIPIVEYGKLRFTSAAGLEEEYMVSNAQMADRFHAAFEAHRAALPPR